MEYPNDTESIDEPGSGAEPENRVEMQTPDEIIETASAQIEIKPPLQHVWRAAITAGVMLVVWGILMAIRFAGMADELLPSLSSMYALRDILFGIGLYLAVARGVKAKVLSLAVFVAALAMIALSRNYYSYYIEGQQITIQTMLSNAQATLLQIMVLVSFAVLFSYALRKNPDKVSFAQTAWFSVGALLIYYIVNVATSKILQGTEAIATSMTNNIIRVCTIAFTAIVTRRMCMAETLAFKQSLMRRIWCIVGAAGVGVYLAMRLMHSTFYLVLYALPVVAIIGFLLLLFGRREGFYAVLFSALIFAMHPLEETLYYIMLGQKQPWETLVTTAIALVIPALTWFLILNPPAPDPQPEEPDIEPLTNAQLDAFVAKAEAAESEPEKTESDEPKPGDTL
jgi:hypothetical protein